MIRRNKAEERIQSEMRKILLENYDFKNLLNGSCLSYFSPLWSLGSSEQLVPSSPSQRESLAKAFYVAAPHRNVERNDALAQSLRQFGIEASVPYDEVYNVFGTGTPSGEPNKVREICIDAILKADGLIVDVDTYGLDTAWEIGYAEGKGKVVIGFNYDLSLKTQERMLNRRDYTENFMHGWPTQKIFQHVADLD